MTFQEKESGRHRQTRGSEKTGQSGRCGRAGTRPLRLEQLVQGENETRKAAVHWTEMKLGASGVRPLSQQPSWCWAVKARTTPELEGTSEPFCSISAPRQSQGANSAWWELPESPRLSKAQLLPQPPRETGILEIAGWFPKFNETSL